MLLILPILLLVLFYFVAIRPSQRQRRQVAETQSRLEPGMEVMTGAGLFGTITRVEDEQVTLEIAPGVQARFLRQTIVRVVEPNEAHSDDTPGSAGPQAS